MYLFSGKQKESTSDNHALVMDEVDGMSGNEDRGGVQELIALIKKSRIPIVAMCNDRNHPKIRSLANYCFDLRFNKPRIEQIRVSIREPVLFMYLFKFLCSCLHLIEYLRFVDFSVKSPYYIVCLPPQDVASACGLSLLFFILFIGTNDVCLFPRRH